MRDATLASVAQPRADLGAAVHYFAIRTAIHVAAVFAIYLSLAMFVPAAVDLYYGHEDWQAFAFSAFLTGGLGLTVAAATQGRPPVLSARFGFLVVNLLWLTTSAVGAVPLIISGLDLTFTDAVFEAVSAITTTGATALVGLDEMAPGILIWRSLLQWIGGLGVIALGLFVLPFLNVGSVAYFRIESNDISDRPFERLSTYTLSLFSIYACFTLLAALCYSSAGMDGFDAINHAMSTISTGGLSTHDTSFARYGDNLAVLWTAIIFMFIGALPFAIVVLLAVRGRADALRDPQLRVFALYLLLFIAAATIYLRLRTGMDFTAAFTNAAFTFTSIISSTGFVADDYTLWGPFIVACAFVATFLGGCSGSTSGGIKAYRILILFELLANGLRRLVYPHTVLPVRYGRKPVDDAMQRAVVLFIAFFFVFWLIGTIALSTTGVEFQTAMNGSLAAITNVGVGFGEMIGPAGNYAEVPSPAKWILAIMMLMGRLEILAVMVIFTPTFWSR